MVPVPDQDQAIGDREGQGVKKDFLDKAEDGGVAADAQGQDDEHRDGEPEVPAECASAEAQVLLP